MGVKDLFRRLFPKAHTRRDKWRHVKCVCRRCGRRFRMHLAPKQSIHAVWGCPKCGQRARIKQATS